MSKYVSIDILERVSKEIMKIKPPFWGLLSILQALRDPIESSVIYEINSEKINRIKQFLADLFYFGSEKPPVSNSECSYVIFSNAWTAEFKAAFFEKDEKVNFYLIALWAFRNDTLPPSCDMEYLKKSFLNKFNIPHEKRGEFLAAFDMTPLDETLVFSDYQVLREDVLKRLKEIRRDNSDKNSYSPGGFVVSSPWELSRAPFVQPLYAGQAIQKCILFSSVPLDEFYDFIKGKKGFASKSSQATVVDCMKKPRQLITYGAPGTGKSHGVEEVVGSSENTVRTTFHPDSDYSTFVGCYKPTMEAKPKYGPQGLPIKVNGVELTEDIISYSYVPQAFTKAYVRAWKSLTPDSEGKVSPQFLVIEEINRGNCAQIFGDLFQLLDRDDGGYSKYAIEADSDLARHISKELANAEGDIPENIRKGTILRLPPNLYIWATMNTSDQSLFPMDSAFKRRWEWRYVPIRDAGKNWKIASDKYDWWEFIKKINGLISSATNSEDKQLGYFFARPDDASSNVISASRFVNKVLFYLYNDVFKDYDLPQAFSKQEGGRFAFGDFFLDNGEADEDAVNELLSGILGEKAE